MGLERGILTMFSKNISGPWACVGSAVERRAALLGQVGLCRAPHTRTHTHTLALLPRTGEEAPVSLHMGLPDPPWPNRRKVFLIRASHCLGGYGSGGGDYGCKSITFRTDTEIISPLKETS